MGDEPKIEKLSQDKNSRTEELVRRFEGKEQRGTLKENEFLAAVGEIIERKEKNGELTSPEGVREAFARFRGSYDKARKEQLKKVVDQSTKKSSIVTEKKEEKSEIPRVESILTMEEFQEAYEKIITKEQWEEIAERFESQSESKELVSPDPTTLRNGDDVLVQLSGSDIANPLKAIFLKPLGADKEGIESYSVQLKESGHSVSVTVNMIMVPKQSIKQEAIPAEPMANEEEIVEIITEEPPVAPTKEKIDFAAGDYVTARVRMNDGSERTINGQIALIGFTKKEKGGVKAAVFSHTLPATDQRVVIIDQSALQLSPGEVIAHRIKNETGFSPKELVKVSDNKNEIYRVVGTDMSSGTLLLELVPNFLFGYSSVREWLKRIEAINYSEQPAEIKEREKLKNKIDVLFANYTIKRPKEDVVHIKNP